MMTEYKHILYTGLKVCLCCQRSLKPSKKSSRVGTFHWGRVLPQGHTMPYYVFLLMMLFQTSSISGFNLDVNFSITATIANTSSYFGLSVGLYATEKESWLLVGAPKLNKEGEIFKCRYEADYATANCSIVQIPKDAAGASNVGAMFGMTLLPGPNEKNLLVCAPRFTVKTTTKDTHAGYNEYYDLVGACYVIDNFINPDIVHTISPCQSEKGVNHNGDQFGQCEIGFSAAFDQEGEHLLLGAPRSFFEGTVMKIPLPINGRIISRIPTFVAGEYYESENVQERIWDDNYFGYSIVTAKTINNISLAIVGAPARLRSDLRGRASVIELPSLATLYTFEGKQMGEGFGSAIAATDLNADGLDDVIIGAPLYSSRKRKIYESGRIFIFYQLDARHREDTVIVDFSEPIVIEGKMPRGQFGCAISAVGDINQDGYEDIAVGAPYTRNGEKSDNMDGSLFIFNGGQEGMVKQASQEIKGIDLAGDMTAFGCSIYGGQDMDGNSYPDIMVGAYLSAQAVMIRSRPVVDISSQVTAEPDVVNLERPSCAAKESANITSCFKITTCFSYSGRHVPKSLELRYVYDVDSKKSQEDKQAFIFDETPRSITLVRKTNTNSESKCVDEYAFFEADIRDKQSDVFIKVSHSLIPKNESVTPVLDDLQPAFSLARVKIYKDCGDDDICQADLRLHSELEVSQIYAGKSWPIALHLHIQNKGDPAYLATLIIEHPIDVQYVGAHKEGLRSGAPLLCTNTDRAVMCELGNPMKRDADIKALLKFQTAKLDGEKSILTIRSFVNSSNPINNTSEIANCVLKIGAMTDTAIYNKSSPTEFYLDTKEKSGFGSDARIVHTYEVINKGPSDISGASFQLRWPSRTIKGLALLKLQKIEKIPNIISCTEEKILSGVHTNSSEENENYHYCQGKTTCASVDCAVLDVSFERFQMNLVFHLVLDTVLQNKGDSYIRSELEFMTHSFPYKISRGGALVFKSMVTTNFIYERETTLKNPAWWLIAIAVLVGLFCLFILVVVMRKCDFFKRKKITKMEGQKQNEFVDPSIAAESELLPRDTED